MMKVRDAVFPELSARRAGKIWIFHIWNIHDQAKVFNHLVALPSSFVKWICIGLKREMGNCKNFVTLFSLSISCFFFIRTYSNSTRVSLTSLNMTQFSLSECTWSLSSLSLPMRPSTTPSVNPIALKLPIIKNPSVVVLYCCHTKLSSFNWSGRTSTVVLYNLSDGCSIDPLRNKYLNWHLITKTRREWQSEFFSFFFAIVLFARASCTEFIYNKSLFAGEAHVRI